LTEKLFFLLRRPPRLEPEAFRRRYLEEHAPLVLRHWSPLRRYVVNLVDHYEGRGDEQPADAIAELVFDAPEDFTDRSRLYRSPEDAAMVESNAAALFGGFAAYRVDGRVQRDYDRSWADGERSPGHKLVGLLRRADGLSHEQFVDHWLNTHVPLVLKHVLGVWRYVTNVVTAPLFPGAPEIDGIVEVHYHDQRTFDSPEGERLMAEDVASFLTPPSRHFVSEYVLRA